MSKTDGTDPKPSTLGPGISPDLEERAGEVEMGNVDPESLYTGRPNYWDKRQKQSGMERKHEAWVLATLNFLSALDIPFYSYKPDGSKDPKGDKDIPERLKLAQEKFFELDSRAARTQRALSDEHGQHRITSSKLRTAQQLIAETYSHLTSQGCEYTEAMTALDAYVQVHFPEMFKEEDEDADAKSV